MGACCCKRKHDADLLFASLENAPTKVQDAAELAEEAATAAAPMAEAEEAAVVLYFTSS